MSDINELLILFLSKYRRKYRNNMCQNNVRQWLYYLKLVFKEKRI